MFIPFVSWQRIRFFQLFIHCNDYLLINGMLTLTLMSVHISCHTNCFFPNKQTAEWRDKLWQIHSALKLISLGKEGHTVSCQLIKLISHAMVMHVIIHNYNQFLCVWRRKGDERVFHLLHCLIINQHLHFMVPAVWLGARRQCSNHLLAKVVAPHCHSKQTSRNNLHFERSRLT